MVQPDEPTPARPERTPLVRLVKGQEVNLGCGTLILIAIIVAICSGGGNRQTDLSPVLHRLDTVDRKLEQIEKQLDQLSRKPKPEREP
jgi:hypothetical protein